VIGGNREVLRAILFEPVAMKLVAIHLDCKDAVDDQVDPLRIAQSHLRNDIMARQPQSALSGNRHSRNYGRRGRWAWPKS